MGDRYRLVEPIERFTPAAGGPSGAGFGYWLALDETRGREVWLLFAENRGRAASGADVAGAVSVLRRLGHRAVPAVPDFGEVEFETAADADADEVYDAEPVVESVGYAVLEPIEGESLSALLLRGALTEAEVLAVLLETAELLRVLHTAELVHGHLSIYSVLVAERGVRLVDLPAALALESAFDSGLTSAADVYAFCWLGCLALVGVDVVEAELGAGFDAGSSPEDAFALTFLTADLIERRRAWAEATLVGVYGVRADLAVLLVAGLGEATQRPGIEVIVESLRAVGSGAGELAGAAAGAAMAAGAAAEAQGGMIGIVAGETGYAVQAGGYPSAAEAGGGAVGEVVEEESVVEAESVGAAVPEDTRPAGAEAAGVGVAAGGIAIAAAMAAEAAAAEVASQATATPVAAAPVQTQAPAQLQTSAPAPAATPVIPAQVSAGQAAAVGVGAAEAAAAASTSRSGGVGVARRAVGTPTGGSSHRSGSGGSGSRSGSGSAGSGSGGSGSGGSKAPTSPVAFASGAHRRPKSAVLVAAGITVLLVAAGVWALVAHRSVPSSPKAGPGSSATALANSASPSSAGGGAGTGSSAKASASASASHASPTAAASGSPAAGSGATPSAGATTPTPGPLATAPSSPGQALTQIQQNISQAQGLGQFPAAAQGPFNQAVGTLQQEISSGSPTVAGTSQLQSALGTPGLPAWFTSRINQLIPYLSSRPGS